MSSTEKKKGGGGETDDVEDQIYFDESEQDARVVSNKVKIESSSPLELWSNDWFQVFQHGWWCSGDPPLPKPIRKEFDQYHPYACQVCKRGPLTSRKKEQKLLTCSQCKVVRYCCHAHQKVDWSAHKLWCRAFCESSTKLQQPDTIVRSLVEWRKHSKQVTTDVTRRMAMSQIPKSSYQMVSMQPVCRNCYASGRTVDKLVTCPRCHGVALCQSCFDQSKTGKKGQYEDYLVFHINETTDTDENASYCQSIEEKAAVQCDGHLLALSCTGMIVEQGVPLTVASDTDCADYFEPANWKEYLQKKRSDFSDVPEHPMMLMAPVVAFITDGLTIPLTILHTLVKVHGSQHVSTMTRLVVHLVGASAIEELSISKFLELARLMPCLNTLTIITIGPDLEQVSEKNAHLWSNPAEGCPLNFIDPSKDFIRPTLNARILRRPTYYHRVVQNDKSFLTDNNTRPTLILACHPGIHDPNYKEHWRPTLDLWIHQLPEVPCVFTSHNRQESEADASIITKQWGSKITMLQPFTRNPFRGMRPFLDHLRTVSDFMYSNSHYFIICGTNQEVEESNHIDDVKDEEQGEDAMASQLLQDLLGAMADSELKQL